MKKSSPKEVFETYKKRFTYFPDFKIEQNPDPDLNYIIVIPCYNEKDLLNTLNSLVACAEPHNKFEVIVVVNSASDTSNTIKEINQTTIDAFYKWNEINISKIKFHCIEALNLPKKKAGVGLARKIGMDVAASRFAQLDKLGWIINLDADCVVSENYLIEIETKVTSEVRGGHFYFEHQLDGLENKDLKTGITLYELHLRYYAQALKHSGFSFWHHTVGSCMISRSDVYALQGGMNQRKAGEDFYFMHKIMPGGNCVTINSATVFPSARISDRVPFGTGKAQGDWIDSGNEVRMTYSFELFSSLKLFFSSLDMWYDGRPDLNEKLDAFLKLISFEDSVSRIKKRSSSKDIFIKNITQFCDGFYTLKMVHYLREYCFGEEDVISASKKLLITLKTQRNDLNVFELLEEFRMLDKTSN